MTSQPLHIFLHIHKTGGSTLQGIINRNYPKQVIYKVLRLKDKDLYGQLPVEQRSKIRMIEGHFPFGIHTAAVTTNITHITMLRHPVERIISAYYFIKKRPDLPIHKRVMEADMTIEELLASGINKLSDNGQVRLLTGEIEREYRTCDEQMYHRAIANIEQHFAVVGLTERFDESVLLMAKELGWKRPWYAPLNKTKGKKPSSQFSPETLALIESYNQWDMKLYEYCVDRLNRQWENNPQLHKKLKGYKRMNAFMRVASNIKRTIIRK